MKTPGFVAQRLVQLAGAFASSLSTHEKTGASSSHSTRFRRPGCVSFALLALLSSAPLAQAQTNPPSGTVVWWGEQFLPSVEPGARFTAIAAGAHHTVALKSDGAVVAWGVNNWGQTTVPIVAKSGVLAIAAGRVHTVALKSDGSVVAWGNNSSAKRRCLSRRGAESQRLWQEDITPWP